MAISSCSKCGNTLFEAVQNEPINANYKYLFIQCASCGTVIGLAEYYNLGASLLEGKGSMLERVKRIEKKVNDLHYAVSQLR